MRMQGAVVGAATLVGVALGWTVVERRLARHRQALFSPRPYRRLAAIGFLEHDASPETVRLLRDYLAWEPQARLRRRARDVLRRLEASLG